MMYRLDPQKFRPAFNDWRKRIARERKSSWAPSDRALDDLARRLDIRPERLRRVVDGSFLIGELALVALARELEVRPASLLQVRSGLTELAPEAPPEPAEELHVSLGGRTRTRLGS